MTLSDYIKKENIFFNLKAKNKYAVIKEIIFQSSTDSNMKDYIYEKVIEREELEPTAVGNGIGIAHAKIDKIETIDIMVGIIKEGIDYESYDETPVNMVFVVVAPVSQNKEYLNVMAKISRVCRHKESVQEMIDYKTVEEVIAKLSSV